MSEDVKPRIFFLQYKRPFDSKVVNGFEGKGEGIKAIELEPTLQLMKEMGDVLNHYLELRPNHDDGAKAFLVLEKYRKFLEGIKK